MLGRSRFIVVLVAFALVIAACGRDPETSGASGDAGATEDVGATGGTEAAGAGDAGDAEGSGEALDVWIMQPGSDEIEQIVTDTATAFEEESGANVDVQFVPWASAHDQFVTAVGGGQVPDLAEMGTTWTPEFAALGALAPIEGEVNEDYIASLVESGTIDGTTYGRPWYAGARGLIYRSDVFEELGLEPPTTWDELVSAGETIEAETDLFPYGVIGNYNHLYLPMVWQAGGEIAVQEGDTWVSQMDSPEAVEAFTFYKDLWDRGWAPEGALQWNSADLRDAFANGDFAMMVGGGWDVSAILSSSPDLEGSVGTALMPEGPGGSRDTFAGGSHLVVFEQSDQKELAAQFADFMLQPENVAEFAQSLGFLPGTVSGVEAAGVLQDEVYGPFAEMLVDYSRTYPPTPAWGGFEGSNLFVNATQEILLGDATPQEALSGVAETMNEEFSDA